MVSFFALLYLRGLYWIYHHSSEHRMEQKMIEVIQKEEIKKNKSENM